MIQIFDIKTINQLLSMPDNTAKLIALDDHVFNLSGKLGFKKLTSTEKIIFCVENLEREVNNGGFSQFFINSSGDYCEETLEALRTINAQKTLSLFEKSLYVFMNNKPSKNRDKRISELEKAGEKADVLLYKLDQEFYKYEDNIEQLLLEYITYHKNDFTKPPLKESIKANIHQILYTKLF
jgi:hypothetical protein